MAASITMDIQARVIGYQEAIAKMKAEFAKIDPGSDIGRKLARAFQGAETQVKNLAKNMFPKASSDSQIDAIIDKVNRAGESILQINQLMQSVGTEDLNLGAFGGDIEEFRRQIAALQEDLTNKLGQGILDAVKGSEELKTVFQDILGVNLDTAKGADLFKAIEKGALSAAKATEQAEHALKDAERKLNENTQTRARIDNGLFGSFDSKTALQNQVQDLERQYEQVFSGVRENIQNKLSEVFSGDVGQQEKILNGFFSGLTPQNVEERIRSLYSTLENAGAYSGDQKRKFYQEVFGVNKAHSSYSDVIKSINFEQANQIKDQFKNLINSFSADMNRPVKLEIESLIDSNSLQTAAEKTEQEIDRIFNRLHKKYTESMNKLPMLEEAVSIARANLVQAQEKQGQITGASNDITRRMSQLEETLKTQQQEINNLKQGLEQAKSREMQKIQGGVRDTAPQIKEQIFPTDAAAKYQAQLDKVQAQERLVGKIEGVAQRWFSIYAVVRMVSNAIRSVISTIRELDKTITEIAIVTSMDQNSLWGQMGSYTDLANKYAASISGVYKVSQLYYQQGLQTADVMALTEQTLKMARISGLDYADATDYMTNAIRSFKMEMQDAQVVVDTYSAVAASSATSVTELASAMSKTASSAQAVGSSLQNTTAMLAVMIEATRESPENIGSAMKSIISRYGELKENKIGIDTEGEEYSLNKVDKALQSIGVSIHDASGQFRDFDDVIFELAEKWDTVNTNTQRYIATVMAGNRQQSRFLALVSSNKRLQEESEIANNSEDAAQLQYLKVLEGAEAKIQNFKNALQSLYLDSGLENTYKGLIDFGTGVIKVFSSMTTIAKQPIPAIIALGTTFYNVANVFTTVFNLVKTKLLAKQQLLQAQITQVQQQESANRITIELREEESEKAAMQRIVEAYRNAQQQMNDAKRQGVNKRNNIQEGTTPTGSGSTGMSSKTKAGISVAASSASLIGTSVAANLQNNGNTKAAGWLGIGSSTLSGVAAGSQGGVWGMVAGGVLGLALGFVQNWNNIFETEEAKLKALQEKAEQANNAFLLQKSSTIDLNKQIQQLKELEKHRYDSVEAEEEYNEAANKVGETYSHLISSIDEAGNVTIDLDEAMAELSDSMMDTVTAAKAAAIANFNLAKKNEEQAESKKDTAPIFNELSISDRKQANREAYFNEVILPTLSTNTENVGPQWLIDLLPSEVDTARQNFITSSSIEREYPEYYIAGKGLDVDNGYLNIAGVFTKSFREALLGTLPEVKTDNAKLLLDLLNSPLEGKDIETFTTINPDSFISDYEYWAYEFLKTRLDASSKDIAKYERSKSQSKSIARSGIAQIIGASSINSSDSFQKELTNSNSILTQMAMQYLYSNGDITNEDYKKFIGEGEENGELQELLISWNEDLENLWSNLTSSKKEQVNNLLKNAKDYSSSQLTSELVKYGFEANSDLTEAMVASAQQNVYTIEKLTTKMNKRSESSIKLGSSITDIIREDYLAEHYGGNDLEVLSDLQDQIDTYVEAGELSIYEASRFINGYSEVLLNLSQLPDLDSATREAAEAKIFANKDWSLEGIYTLAEELKKIGISDKVIERVKSLQKYVPKNLVSDIDSFTNIVTSNLQDFDKALSNAAKGMEYDDALKLADRLGLTLDAFTFKEGKYFYTTENAANLIKEKYLETNNDLKEALEEEYNAIMDVDGVLSKTIGSDSILMALKNAAANIEGWEDLQLDDQVAELQKLEGFENLDLVSTVKIYNKYYQAWQDQLNSENGIKDFTEYARKQYEDSHKNMLAFFDQYNEYQVNAFLISNNQLKAFIENLLGQNSGVTQQDLLRLAQNQISIDDLDLTDEQKKALEQFIPLLISTYKDINSTIFEGLIKGLEDPTQTIDISKIPEEIIKDLENKHLIKISGASARVIGNIFDIVSEIMLSDLDIASKSDFVDKAINASRDRSKNIIDELDKLSQSKTGDLINISYLQDTFGEGIKTLLEQYGMAVADGFAQITTTTDIPGAIQALMALADNNNILLENEFAELQDTVLELIKEITNIIEDGIEGKLSYADANTLKEWMKKYSPDTQLDFTETIDGLQLTFNSVLDVYNVLKQINDTQAQQVFDKLNETLQKTNEHYKSISSIMQRIAEIDSIAPDVRSEEYKRELALAKEILAVRSTTDDASFSFMSNKIPGGQNNPLNYYSNWASAIQKLQEAMTTTSTTSDGKTHKGLIDYQDWYNIATEMGNMARVTGKEFELAGITIDGSLENTAALIEKGASALTVDSTGNLKVALGDIGIDFEAGAGEMSNGINSGIKAMAESQIKMLDGMIRLLEAVVAMEKLGDITGEDNNIDISDIFPHLTWEEKETINNQTLRSWIEGTLLAAEEGSDLYKALETLAINGKSFRELAENAIEGGLEYGEGQDFAVLLDALYKMYSSGDYDPDNVLASIQQVASAAGFNGQIQLGDIELQFTAGEIITKDKDNNYIWNGTKYKNEEEVMKAIQQVNLHKWQAAVRNGKINHVEATDNDITFTINDKAIKLVLQGDGTFTVEGGDGTSYKTIQDYIMTYAQAGETNAEEVMYRIGIKVAPDLDENISSEIKNKLSTVAWDDISLDAQKVANHEMTEIQFQVKYGITAESVNKIQNEDEFKKLIASESKDVFVGLNVSIDEASEEEAKKLVSAFGGTTVPVDLKVNSGKVGAATDAAVSNVEAASAQALAEIEAARTEAEAATNELNAAKDQVNALSEKLEKQKDELAWSNAENQAAITAAEQKLQEALETQQVAEAKAKEAQARLAEVSAAKDQADTNLTTALAELSNTQTALQQALTDADTATETANELLSSATQSLEGVEQAAKDTLSSEAEEATKSIAQAGVKAGQAASTAVQLAHNSMLSQVTTEVEAIQTAGAVAAEKIEVLIAQLEALSGKNTSQVVAGLVKEDWSNPAETPEEAARRAVLTARYSYNTATNDEQRAAAAQAENQAVSEYLHYLASNGEEMPGELYGDNGLVTGWVRGTHLANYFMRSTTDKAYNPLSANGKINYGNVNINSKEGQAQIVKLDNFYNEIIAIGEEIPDQRPINTIAGSEVLNKANKTLEANYLAYNALVNDFNSKSSLTEEDLIDYKERFQQAKQAIDDQIKMINIFANLSDTADTNSDNNGPKHFIATKVSEAETILSEYIDGHKTLEEAMAAINKIITEMETATTAYNQNKEDLNFDQVDALIEDYYDITSFENYQDKLGKAKKAQDKLTMAQAEFDYAFAAQQQDPENLQLMALVTQTAEQLKAAQTAYQQAQAQVDAIKEMFATSDQTNAVINQWQEGSEAEKEQALIEGKDAVDALIAEKTEELSQVGAYNELAEPEDVNVIDYSQQVREEQQKRNTAKTVAADQSQWADRVAQTLNELSADTDIDSYNRAISNAEEAIQVLSEDIENLYEDDTEKKQRDEAAKALADSLKEAIDRVAAEREQKRLAEFDAEEEVEFLDELGQPIPSPVDEVNAGLSETAEVASETEEKIKELENEVNELDGTTANIDINYNVKYNYSDKSPGYFMTRDEATGNFGLAKVQGTLMGELGPELVVSNGRYFVAGQNGPEMIDLADDAIVFNHLQTKSLLNKGMSSGRGKVVTNERNAISFAKGNVNGGPAMASASAALAALRQLRAEWQALAGLSVADLAGKGGGGGGGGDKDLPGFIRDVERWYNWLQKIADCEKKINYEEQLRSKIQSDMISNGKAFYASQKEQLRQLEQSVTTSSSLYLSQLEYFEKRREQLNNNSPLSELYRFDESGQLHYQEGSYQWLAQLFKTNDYGALELSPKEQYEMILARNPEFAQYMKYNSEGKEIKEKDYQENKDQYYLDMVKAFSDRMDAEKEEMQNLFDSYTEQAKAVNEKLQQQNELIQAMKDNQKEVEEAVLGAIVESRERQIKELQDTKDALQKSNEDFIDGLSKQLEKEQKMYQNNESNQELQRNRRQLAILQRSGASASQIAQLQKEIQQQSQDEYFNKQQEQIDAIQEASDLQIERLDHQIEIAQEQLEYEKANGLLWSQVYEVMAGTPEQISSFITENTEAEWAKSPLSSTEAANDWIFKTEQWTEYRDDIHGIYDALTAAWGMFDESMQQMFGDSWTEDIDPETKKALQTQFMQEYQRTGDYNEAAKLIQGTDTYQELKRKQEEEAAAAYTPVEQSSTTTSQPTTNYPHWKFTFDGRERIGFLSEERARNAIEQMAKEVRDKGNGQGLTVAEYYNNLGNKQKQEALKTLTKYKSGGLIDYTGPAWVDGTPQQPESIWDAETTKLMRDNLLNSRNLNLLGTFWDTLQGYQTSTNHSYSNSSESLVIENAVVNMNVASIANDYDARRAGEQAMEEMLKIARKTSVSSFKRG